MKGYSEQRGVQSKVIFDAATGCFVQRKVVHDFALITATDVEHPPDAVITTLPDRKVLPKATSSSRKRRHAVMQIVNMQHAV